MKLQKKPLNNILIGGRREGKNYVIFTLESRIAQVFEEYCHINNIEYAIMSQNGGNITFSTEKDGYIDFIHDTSTKGLFRRDEK